MKPFRVVVIAAVLLVAAGAAWYFWPHRVPPPPPPAPAAVSEAPPASAPAQEAEQHYPLEPAPAPQEKPLPALKESDGGLREAITKVVGADAFERYFVPEQIVRRIVATIDNLPRKTYAQRLSPVRPAGGLLVVQGPEDDLVIAPGNAQRYAPYVKLVQSLDARQVVAVYRHFYPLFQQAYVELGYPNGYFNDRLVQVIDHLLATPPVEGPIHLVVPHVLYQYADPELESLSSGQKLLIRMGRENADKVKAKLREIRAQLVGPKR